MLEPVGTSQTRFVTPGLAPDPRGVAMGRYGLFLFPSIERVIGFFHGLSEKLSLDDYLASLCLFQVRTPLKSREFVVQLAVNSSHTMDGIAQVSHLMGGLTFTGSSKHFVKFRDSHAPLGYDVISLFSSPNDFDFIFYDSTFVQGYEKEREIPFKRLIANLSLQSTNTGALDRNEPLLLWVCPGLWRSVAGYLHRNHLQCAIAIARDDENAHKRQNFYLFRCSLPTRIERLFANMPGVEAYRFITDNVAVQLGYKHPIELRSCSRVFESNRFFLFSGDRNQLTTFPWPASFVNAESIIQMHPSQSTIFELTETPGGPTPLTVDLNLIPSPTLHRKCSASCIPLSQAPWLKKLVYLLPPSVLDSHRICSTKEGIFLYREAETELIPLGEMYYRAAQGIYVSLGYEIHPQFHPAVLERHLQTKDEKLVFFTTRSPRPIQIPKHSFKPLAHELLSHIPLQTLQSETSPEQRPTPPSAIVNEPLAIFPLWGFRSKNKTDKED